MPDESRDGDNLVALRQARVRHQVDDVDAVAAREVRFAQFLQVGDCRNGSRGLAGYVEPEIVALYLRLHRSYRFLAALTAVIQMLQPTPAATFRQRRGCEPCGRARRCAGARLRSRPLPGDRSPAARPPVGLAAPGLAPRSGDVGA